MISVIALLVGIALLIFLVVKTKIQAFPALIFSAIVIGLLSGLPTDKTISAVTKGFGNTLASIGIVIGLGCIMGKFLEKSGAVKRMALTILKGVGIKRADVVLGITGLLVSIPVFCDSGFVILSSLAKEFSRLTRKSMILMGGLLGMGLYITHFLVPPTPGPLAVCGAFNIDIGVFILFGVLLAIPLFILAVFYFRWIAKKNPDIIPEIGEDDFDQLTPEQRSTLEKIEAKQQSGQELTNDDFNELLKDEAMPGTFISFATLLVPILLILVNTILGMMKVTGPVKSFFTLVGSPVCALFISVLMGVYMLCRSLSKSEALKLMESALADGGLIVFVTGAGGALGGVISATGVGTLMAKGIVAAGLPAILVPLLVGTLLRFPQGSGTAAMVTGASILAPMLPTLGINPVLAGLALCSTSMCPSYMNDSYFWVVTRFSGFDEKTSLKTWTPATILIPFASAIILMIVNAIFF
jgi:GntP family gluconate:H+ symporter